MLDKHLGRTDRVLIAISFLGVIAFGVAFYYQNEIVSYFNTNVRENMQPVGEVTRTDRDVRRRMARSLTWYELDNGETLYQRDGVFSGDESEVQFKIGASEVTVGENSLVYIDIENGELMLNLELGTVYANVVAPKKLIVRHNGLQTKILADKNSIPIHLTKDSAGKIRVSSQNGLLQIQRGQVTKKIDTTESIRLDNALLVEKKIDNVTAMVPKDRDTLWLRSDERIKFKWENRGSDNIQLEVSRDRDFKVIESSTSVEAAAQEVNLDLPLEGFYYWRFTAGSDGRVISEARSFNLNRLSPVRLVAPVDDIELAAVETVHFQWVPKRDVTKYKIKLMQKTDAGEQVISSQDVEGKSVRLPVAMGEYRWTVSYNVNNEWVETAPGWSFRTTDQKKNQPLAVETAKPDMASGPLNSAKGQGTDVSPAPAPAKPDFEIASGMPSVLKQGEKESVLLKFPRLTPKQMQDAKPVNPPILSWQPLEGVSEYTVEISDNKNFIGAKVVDAEFRNAHIWKEVQPGRYYWRSRPKGSERALASEETQWGEFRVLLPQPKIRPISPQVENTPDEDGIREPILIELEWTPVPMAARYRVEALGEKKIVSENKLPIELYDIGLYDVKVSALNGQNEPASKMSTSQIEVKMRTPASKLPVNKVVMVKFKDEKTASPLLFAWTRVVSAEEYEIEFSYDPEFQNIFRREKVKRPAFIARDFAGASPTVFWRVRGVRGQTISDWSDVRSFTVTELSEQSEKRE